MTDTSNTLSVTPWSTFDAYFDVCAGAWHEQRIATVHAPAIEKLFNGKHPVQERQPRFDLLGGGLGVGKSRLARKLSVEHPNSVLIDADSLKAAIPELEWFKRENLTNAWLRVQDESRHIAQEALRGAIVGRYDIILDTCSSQPETRDLILGIKARGYLLAYQFVDTPFEIALKRIHKAASVPGRAHYGRSMFRNEFNPPKPGEIVHDFPEGWEFVVDLFAGKNEYEVWSQRLVEAEQRRFEEPPGKPLLA